MQKLLISIPDQLVLRMRAVIPNRQRSKEISSLIEKEVEKREKSLFNCALAVEKDQNLKNEMSDWNITLQDGLTDESW